MQQSTQTAHGSALAGSIGKHALFGMMANGTQVLTRFVTIPIVISHLGLGGYGIWNIITLTATYMRFGSVGVKTAFQKYVAEATGNGDYQKASTLLSTGCAIMLALSVAALLPVAYWSEQIAQWSGVPDEFLTSGARAISLLAVTMVLANTGAAFEAIVLGGHRIDLVQKFTAVLTLCEAVGTMSVLSLGGGLFGMASVMVVSELIFITACLIASRRVVPQIELHPRWFDTKAFGELFRYAGSYQLVNVLEVVTGWLVPAVLLRAFGAAEVGLFSVVSRVVVSTNILRDAFLSPILSSGTRVYASGSADAMQMLLTKAFKVTIGLSLATLGFVSAFGPTMVLAWLGETNAGFPVTFWLVSLMGLFSATSLLALVLYRVSGNGVMDNIRQLIRIAASVAVGMFAAQLGFYGVLGGFAVIELAGMLFMMHVLTRTFPTFRASSLLPEVGRMLAAVILLLAAGALLSQIPLPVDSAGRLGAFLKLVAICLGCALAAWPAMVWTGSINAEEKAVLLHSLPWSRKSGTGTAAFAKPE